MDFMADFSDRLSELMSDAALTSDQLGEKIGVAGAAVRFWKTKKTVISLSHAVAIAELFGCSLEYLFGRTDNLLNFKPYPALPFYKRLTQIMADKKISRYKICIELKKGHGHFDTWKKGADPRMNIALDFAAYFGVTLDYLTGRER